MVWKKNLQCSLTSLLVVFSCLTRITACPHLMRCQLKIMDVHTQQISLNRHALFSAFGAGYSASCSGIETSLLWVRVPDFCSAHLKTPFGALMNEKLLLDAQCKNIMLPSLEMWPSAGYTCWLGVFIEISLALMLDSSPKNKILPFTFPHVLSTLSDFHLCNTKEDILKNVGS